MKATIATVGSRGDVQPMLALALGLKATGIDINFCAPPNFEEFIKAFGLNFFPLGLSNQQIATEHPDFFGRKKIPLKTINLITTKQTQAQFELLPQIAKDSDFLVGGGPLYGGASIAELLQIPYFFALLFPNFLPSSSYPPPMSTPHQNLPRWLNSLIWKSAKIYFNRASKPPLNLERKKIGLPPIKDYLTYLFQDHLIVAVDEELSPVPQDFSFSYFQPGAFILDRHEPLAPEIMSFLNQGPAPVYVGFGSMPLKDPQKATQMFIHLSKKLNLRFILDKGWSDLGNIPLPPEILVISGAPHDKLFPKMAAVIHHAGSGTIATAARAGVPQIAIPIAFDQFYWGKRLKISNLGPAPCLVYKLSEKYLEKALKQSLNDNKIKRNVEELKNRLLQKKPIQTTIEYILNNLHKKQ